MTYRTVTPIQTVKRINEITEIRYMVRAYSNDGSHLLIEGLSEEQIKNFKEGTEITFNLG